MRRWPRASGWARPATRVAVDGVLIGVALADALLGLYQATPVATGLSIVAAAGLVFRRHLPYLSLLLALPGLFLGSGLVAVMIALYSVAAYTRARMPMIAGVIGALLGYVVFVDIPTTLEDTTLTGIYGLLFVVGPTALGLLTATRVELSDRIQQLHVAQDEERRLAAEQALARERVNLAREMHDVVSHQISLIAIQAGALQVNAPDPDARRTARTIRTLCVATLEELRTMVGVLRRAGGTDTGLTPPPGLSEIAHLIGTSGIAAVANIQLPDDLPPNVQRTIYRTIQEALTNARKHAPDAPVEITAHIDQGIRVQIYSGPARTAPSSLPSAGVGITGLRERAELLGGTLTTRHDTTGFRINLTLPAPAGN